MLSSMISSSCFRSLEADQLNLEDESGVWGDDTTGALGTVSHLWGDGEDGLASFFHLGNTLIPSLDDLTNTNLALEGGSAGDGAVENFSVCELASVVHGDLHADLAELRPMQRIGATTGLEHNHLIGLAGGLAVLVLLIILWCSLCRSKRPRGGTGTRASFPAFDLEGNAGGALPPPVTTAAKLGDVASLRVWLSDERCVIDACSADGATALHSGARHGHAHVIRLLIEAGADALSVDPDLRTALHLVAAAGHGMCVKALLDAGSDPEGRDAEGNTPMTLAESGKHMGCLRMMRIYQERGAGVQGGERAHRRPK